MYAYMHAWASGAIIHTYTYMCTDTCMQMHTLTWQQEPPKPRHVLDSEALEGFLQRQKMYGEHNLAKDEESGMVWCILCVCSYILCVYACMYACLLVCMCVYNMWEYLHLVRISMYVFMNTCMYTCMYVYIHACMACMHAYIYVCMYICMYLSKHEYIYVCVCVCVFECEYTHVCALEMQ